MSLPGADLYCPTAQAAHVSDADLIAPEYPAWHKQSDAAAQPVPSPLAHVVVMELAGQLVQTPAPSPGLNVPTAQTAQASPLFVMVPEYPALHRQAVIACESGPAVSALAGHGVQADAPAESA